MNRLPGSARFEQAIDVHPSASRAESGTSARSGSPLTDAGTRRFVALFVLFLLLLAWMPIPVGSNRGWSQGLLTTMLFTLSGTWAFAYARSPFEVPTAIACCRLPGLLLLAWASVALVQLLPGPASPLAGHGIGTPPGGALGSVSLDPDATLGGFLREAGLVAALFLTLALVSTRGRLRLMLVVLAGIGFAEAFYGLVLVFADADSALWNPGHLPGNVSGTYVNQNHFAGLMELTIPATIGLLMTRGWSQGERKGLGTVARRLTDIALDGRAIASFLIVIMVTALVLTTSRGAVASVLVAVCATLALSAWRQRSHRRTLRAGLVLASVVIAALVWLDKGSFFDKVRSAGLESNRSELREVSYRMVADHPLLGTGVGTYRWVFPVYKDSRFGSGFYEHAHNDFLEMLGEQGFVGFALIAGAVAVILMRVGGAIVRRRDPLARGALFASFAGCSSLLVHGLVDFNLQIPANATYFFVLLGIGLVAARIDGAVPGE